MTDHLRSLAVQAWKRVTELGHDPVESIHRALLHATTGTELPAWAAALYPTERAVVLVLMAGRLPLRTIAKELGTTNRAACLRLRRLRKRGLVQRDGHGTYHLASWTPSVQVNDKVAGAPMGRPITNLSAKAARWRERYRQRKGTRCA